MPDRRNPEPTQQKRGTYGSTDTIKTAGKKGTSRILPAEINRWHTLRELDQKRKC
jgi:hypothetical protein